MKKTQQAPLALDALNLGNTNGEKAAGTLNDAATFLCPV